MSDVFTLLVVEDDVPTRAFLSANLEADGFAVGVAGSVQAGLAVLESTFPDLVVCDVGLPDGSGLTLLSRLRAGTEFGARIDSRTPVLMLSGRDSEIDVLRGFDRGADDYLKKPFSYPELRARVGALLTRAQERPARGLVRVGELEVDPVARLARIRGDAVTLSQKEFAILRILASDPERVWSKHELLRLVWGPDANSSSRTLDSHCCRLRAKLGIHGDPFVVNVWGVGYRLIELGWHRGAA